MRFKTRNECLEMNAQRPNQLLFYFIIYFLFVGFEIYPHFPVFPLKLASPLSGRFLELPPLFGPIQKVILLFPIHSYASDIYSLVSILRILYFALYPFRKQIFYKVYIITGSAHHISRYRDFNDLLIMSHFRVFLNWFIASHVHMFKDA